MMMWRALKPETAAAVLRHYLDKRAERTAPASAETEPSVPGPRPAPAGGAAKPSGAEGR